MEGVNHTAKRKISEHKGGFCVSLFVSLNEVFISVLKKKKEIQLSLGSRQLSDFRFGVRGKKVVNYGSRLDLTSSFRCKIPTMTYGKHWEITENQRTPKVSIKCTL